MQRKVRFSAATSGGTASISITIPGTFTTLQPNTSNFSGRVISKIQAFFGSPAAGDYCSGFVVSDPNGVIPSGEQSLFPNYPTIFSFADPQLSGGNPGFYLPTNEPAVFIPEQNFGIVPSGLVLTATFVKATLSLGDTAYVNIDWDDYTVII